MAGQENGVSLSLLVEQIYWIGKAAHEERLKLGTIASLPKTLIACGMIPLHPVLVRGKYTAAPALQPTAGPVRMNQGD